MTARIIVLATLAVSAFAGGASAEDRTFLTPPLYRDQARDTAKVRRASELTTIPSAIPGATPVRRVVAEAMDPSAR